MTAQADREKAGAVAHPIDFKDGQDALERHRGRVEEDVAGRACELGREHAFAHAVLEEQPVPVVVLDLDGGLLQANRCCREATGLDPAGSRGGRTWLDLMPAVERDAAMAALGRVTAGEGPLVHEAHWRHRDGTDHLYEWRIALAEDGGEGIRAIIASALDVTGQRQAEAEARQRLADAAHLQRLQTANELTNVVAHEVNQPLGTIAILVAAARQLLEDPETNKARLAENLQEIARQAEYGGKVVRRMRCLVTRGDGLTAVPLDVASVLAEARDLVAPRACHGGIRLELAVPVGLPPVLAVRGHLEQVVLNLVSNAIEAMQDAAVQGGSITLSARREEGAVRVTVRDEGPGVDAATAARLFDPLFSTKKEALGIGLVLSRCLVEADGGRLWAEQGGPGGVFHFTLPLAV